MADTEPVEPLPDEVWTACADAYRAANEALNVGAHNTVGVPGLIAALATAYAAGRASVLEGAVEESALQREEEHATCLWLAGCDKAKEPGTGFCVEHNRRMDGEGCS